MAHTVQLTAPEGDIAGTIQLTGSKSESNRALIIRAFGKGKVHIENLSEADDTATLHKELERASSRQSPDELVIDIGPAGTAMRFLAGFLPLQDGKFMLTGTERMKQRPIALLVDAMRHIGADIRYAGETGYPPLSISGPIQQRANKVTIRGDVSSQYLSSLLLIAGALPQGLTVNIQGELTSRPYLHMTLNMLAEAGIAHRWDDSSITIEAQEARESTIYVEPDWSAASYWYSLVALSPKGTELYLPGLKSNSLQGDSAITQLMKHYGVASRFEDRGVKITKVADAHAPNLFNLKECPDLAQTLVVCSAALGIDDSFTGLETLKIKETDRISALQNELAKIGVQFMEEQAEIYKLHTVKTIRPRQVSIKTYEDHRMAMAFAPLAIAFGQITIEEPNVVGKSYPDYWKHLEQVGFRVTMT